MPRPSVSRRNLLKTTAFAAASVVSAPYLRHSYAAGKLTLGVWDHWVPGANNTLTKLCNEWGEKNKVEVTIDYITSQGDKDILTASAEAQARAGHDIMSHRAWQIQVHRNVLEPVDDVIKALIPRVARSVRYPNISPNTTASGSAFRQRLAVRSNRAALASICTSSTAASI
jgi:hypothetical protein